MDKFWIWMRNKSRLSTHELSYVDKTSFVIHHNGVIYKGANHDYKDLPKQMLIGYMMEYCIEKGCIATPSNKVMEIRNVEKYYEELKDHIQTL